MNILQKIFIDHFEEMIYLQHPPNSIIENVEKMIHCGGPAFGGALFACPCCGNFKFVAFRCHSRFCPTCGNMYSIDRTTSMSFKVISVQHRHCLISEGGVGNSLLWQHVKHFNYKLLRDSFQTALLNELHLRIGRYLGRPVIATSRIDSYDGDSVTFHYNRHEDDQLMIETLPALEFIARLTQHIPEKHFKMIRYYGIYAKHRSSDKRLRRAILKEKHKLYLSFNRWRDSSLHSFGYDPLKCSICRNVMLFLKLYFNHRPVPLHELYEKAMRKHLCRSPALLLFLSYLPFS